MSVISTMFGDSPDPEAAARAIRRALDVTPYPASIVASSDRLFAVARTAGFERRVVVAARQPLEIPAEKVVAVDGVKLHLLAAGFDAASFFQQALPALKPVPLGLALSAGMGDRLGLATPGHVRAVRGTGIRPVFPQQSIREMSRTGRTPRDVMADAVFGALQEGFLSGFGSDADHLKTTDDIDSCLQAGFTMFTVDPGDHVDNDADALPAARLDELAARLPWSAMETTLQDSVSRYAGAVSLPGDIDVAAADIDVLRAAVKYGSAVAYAANMYRHLASKAPEGAFELEISVDETQAPTTVFEHFYFASELKRLGVKWVSLAPRYVGRFEKGVDYIGDMDVFVRELKGHAAVMRHLGPYKMSIHSGSDKFSVYPVIADIAGPYVHLKTAGTSYLAALGALARVEPAFIRRIYRFARERYETDKATYHVSADLARTPDPAAVADADLVPLIDEFNARQVFHVTFGSVLQEHDASGRYLFRDELYALLRRHEDVHLDVLSAHIRRHLDPFAVA